MTVNRCYLCEQDPEARRLFGRAGFAEGQDCPVCYLPVCRYHLTTVRWRWRDSGDADEALVCKDCRRTYAHRNWDTHRRDWIT